MKQTTKRVLSMVLSVLMLVSVMTTFVFAENNYKPDEEYYNRIISDAVIVGDTWAGLTDGDTVTYVFRGKTYTEEFDSNIHFTSMSAAYQHCLDSNVKSPVIVLVAGAYMADLTLKSSVTIIGANGGINPNVVPEDKAQEWAANPARGQESVVKGCIAVHKFYSESTEVVLDGVTLGKGFAFVDIGTKTCKSSAIIRNAVIDGAGGRSYNNTAVTNVISFAGATGAVTSAKFENIRCRNMRSTSLAGTGVANLVIDGVYYYDSTSPAILFGDAPLNQNANFVVSNSTFYNVHSNYGAINVDPSINDSSSRNDAYLEVSGCSFVEPEDFVPNEDQRKISPITHTVVGAKSRLNVHDCTFKSSYDSPVPAVGFTYTTAAFNGAYTDTIKFNSNKALGYNVLPDTSGLVQSTKLNYNDNFFGDFTGEQANPVFPSSASKNNLTVDSYWIDEAMTIPSSIFHLTSTGINGQVNNIDNEVTASVQYGQKAVFDFKANDPTVTYTVYDADMANVVTEVNSVDLISGSGKNIFYAVGKSSKTDFNYIYKVILSSYDPQYIAPFDLENTYMITTDVAGLSAGENYYNSWDGMVYRFTVGVNVFAEATEIFNVCKDVPVIIVPAGVYDKEIHLLGSAVVLGAKHGIDPNIKQFTDPDIGWELNPARANPDEESILRAVIGIDEGIANATVLIDGFTFGTSSGYFDQGASLEGYHTEIIKNIIVDGAGGGTFTIAERPLGIGTVFNVGGGATNVYGNMHKDTRIVNLRMVSQNDAKLIGDYYESLVLDGLYVAQNTTTLHKNEWSHTGNQDLNLEIRNSCFFKNAGGTYYILFNLTTNDDSKTNPRYNTITLRNNTFYDTTGSPYGVYGVRFNSSRDALRVYGNTFIATGANAFMPGSTNWWIGSFIAYNWTAPEKYNLADIGKVEDVVIRMNRFIGCTQAVDMTGGHPDTVWDYSFNYYCKTYGKENAGIKCAINGTGQEKNMTCSPYFSDWNLTTLAGNDNTAETKNRIAKFNSEFEYKIEGPGVLDEQAKTYTDTVAASVTNYDFGINLITPQAKCTIYSDRAMSEVVQNPVPLTGSTNNFFIKFSNFDGSNSVTYTAKINKPLGTEANVVSFGNWRVADSIVYAAVQPGADEFVIPEITVSDGANYALYKDANCTEAYTAGTVAVNGIVPSYIYIKVNSEDKSKSKVYTVSIVAAESDQNEITAIANATKVSSTAFAATIPAGTYSFDLYPTVSDNAKLYVVENGMNVEVTGDKYVIDSIVGEKTVDLIVENAAGKRKSFTLTVSTAGSSCDVAYILGMSNGYQGEYFFDARTRENTYRVNPTLVDKNATYELYYDAACTNKVVGNLIILKQKVSKAYMKVTSADGAKSRVYTINITSSSNDFSQATALIDDAYEIKDAKFVEFDGTTNIYEIEAPDNAETYVLKFNFNAEKYPYSQILFYSDAKMTRSLGGWHRIAENNDSQEIKLLSKETTIYGKVYISTVEDKTAQLDNYIVKIISKRPTVRYTDESDIASWAIEQVKYLNENGFGYFQGDNGKFKPRANMTRFEVAAIACRVLGLNVEDYTNIILPFTDTIPNWAKNYVNAVYSSGIMSGATGSNGKPVFNGSKPTTREQFAKIIVNVVAIAKGDLPANAADAAGLYTIVKEDVDAEYAKVNFVDEDTISNWAKPYVKLAVSYYGLINGSKDGDNLKFNPKVNISRQEVAIIVANYSGYKAAQ